MWSAPFADHRFQLYKKKASRISNIHYPLLPACRSNVNSCFLKLLIRSLPFMLDLELWIKNIFTFKLILSGHFIIAMRKSNNAQFFSNIRNQILQTYLKTESGLFRVIHRNEDNKNATLYGEYKDLEICYLISLKLLL